MKLSIYTDATGKKTYKICKEDGTGMVSSELLVRYRIENGEITNAYVDDNGEIQLVNTIKDALVKSEERIQAENKLMEKLGETKYEILAVVKDKGKTSGYYVARVGRGLQDAKAIKKSMAILYASVGAIVNAHVEFDGKGEYLVGNDISLDNLAVMGDTIKQKEEIKSNVKIADGLIHISWQQVKDIKEILSTSEVVDRRSDINLNGCKYPRTSLLSRCKLSITLNSDSADIVVTNLMDVAHDKTSSLILETRYDNKNYRIECHDVNIMEMNCYMAALTGYIGIKQISRRVDLKDIVVTDEENRMWRMYFKTESAVVEDKTIKISKDTVLNMKTMYSLSVSEISVKETREQERLLSGLRLGKASLRITCDKEYYDMTEFVCSPGDIKRIDFTLRRSDDVEYRYYFAGLDLKIYNIRNIILICAAGVSNISEIKNISVRALDRDSEFLVLFKSKIR